MQAKQLQYKVHQKLHEMKCTAFIMDEHRSNYGSAARTTEASKVTNTTGWAAGASIVDKNTPIK